MDMQLPPDVEAYLAEQVKRGIYASAGDAVVEALRRRMREDDVAELREKLRRSEEDVKAGRTAVADDAFFEAKRQRVRDLYINAAE